jgi:hypothetical protein
MMLQFNDDLWDVMTVHECLQEGDVEPDALDDDDMDDDL